MCNHFNLCQVTARVLPNKQLPFSTHAKMQRLPIFLLVQESLEHGHLLPLHLSCLKRWECYCAHSCQEKPRTYRSNLSSIRSTSTSSEPSDQNRAGLKPPKSTEPKRRVIKALYRMQQETPKTEIGLSIYIAKKIRRRVTSHARLRRTNAIHQMRPA